MVKEQVERLQRASVHIQEKTSKLVDQVKEQVGSQVGAVLRESHSLSSSGNLHCPPSLVLVVNLHEFAFRLRIHSFGI